MKPTTKLPYELAQAIARRELASVKQTVRDYMPILSTGLSMQREAVLGILGRWSAAAIRSAFDTMVMKGHDWQNRYSLSQVLIEIEQHLHEAQRVQEAMHK